MTFIFDPPSVPVVAISGSSSLFPVRRIFCVGRNYEQHAREMGAHSREAPFFFMKPPDAIVPDGAVVPFPPQTDNFHHEVELVVAIGKSGFEISPRSVNDHIFGYAVGNDLTRRDLQLALRDKGRPWELGKSFEFSAPISAIEPAERIGHPDRGRIWLKVNDEPRQDADIQDLIWQVPDVVAFLSTYYRLQPGDLIFTGTPAGVGTVDPGDIITAGIDGIGTLVTTIGSAEWQ